MSDFIRNENLKLYRSALAHCTDKEQRRVLLELLRLLAAEQAAVARRPAKFARDPDPVD